MITSSFIVKEMDIGVADKIRNITVSGDDFKDMYKKLHDYLENFYEDKIVLFPSGKYIFGTLLKSGGYLIIKSSDSTYARAISGIYY